MENNLMNKSYLDTINTKRLVSNQGYQRPVEPKKVNEILKDYDEARFGTIQVSLRDGIYYVFDGQNRIAVAKARNGGKDIGVPCQVYLGLTYEDEARLFAEQDKNKTRVDYIYKDRAYYESGDKNIKNMKAIAEAVGLNVPFTKVRKNNTITATTTLKNLYSELGARDYGRLLLLVKNTWDGESASLERDILEGMKVFYTLYKGEMKDDVFVKKLRDTSAARIKKISVNNAVRIPKSVAIAQTFFREYNHGLRNKLPYRFAI